MGKSDHVLMEVTLKEGMTERREDDHKKGRFNYAKTNFVELRNFLGSTDWKRHLKGKTVQEKYEMFLEKYKEGVQRYVPVHKTRESIHSWYNARCARAKKIKDATWRKLKKHRNDINREQYKEARNEYV